jgi:hypothetical protein
LHQYRWIFRYRHIRQQLHVLRQDVFWIHPQLPVCFVPYDLNSYKVRNYVLHNKSGVCRKSNCYQAYGRVFYSTTWLRGLLSHRRISFLHTPLGLYPPPHLFCYRKKQAFKAAFAAQAFWACSCVDIT